MGFSSKEERFKEDPLTKISKEMPGPGEYETKNGLVDSLVSKPASSLQWVAPNKKGLEKIPEEEEKPGPGYYSPESCVLLKPIGSSDDHESSAFAGPAKFLPIPGISGNRIHLFFE